MNLLIVDDEYYIVQGIVDSIFWDDIGINTVFTAYSAEQAKKIIENKPVDILLTDIEMPHSSGLNLLEWIYDNGYDIVTLILSGHQRFDYAHKAIRMHCFSYILKPVEKQLLKLELQKAVNLKHASAIDHKDTSVEEVEEDTFITLVRNYIHDNLSSSNLNRIDIANAVHMNPDYLSYLFHKKFGQTLNIYITTARIDAAKQLLLTTNLSLQAISDKAGFSNSSYFHRQFKKITGLTPIQFCKKNK